MKRLSLLSITTCLGFVAVGMIPSLRADPVKHRTEVTFSGPTEIPGTVLNPGTYVMKVPDPYSHADMVGFYNPDESHLYKLVRTIPAYRVNITDKTVITFEERANGAPQAIHKWFTPDDHYGYEFIYPKAETLPQVAEATPPPPPAVTPAPRPAPQPVAQTPPPAPPAPVQVAQATPPPARPAPAPAPAKELPKTASDYPLVLSAGIFLLAAGVFLRLKA
jgi:hypothetical protein